MNLSLDQVRARIEEYLPYSPGKARVLSCNLSISQKRLIEREYPLLKPEKPRRGLGVASFPILFERPREGQLGLVIDLAVERSRRFKSITQYPEHFQAVVALAMGDAGIEFPIEEISLQLFPDLPFSLNTEENETQALTIRGESYSAALYVAMRLLLATHTLDYSPILTGELQDKRLVSFSPEILEQKLRVVGTLQLRPLISPQYDETPDQLWNRIVTSPLNIAQMRHLLRRHDYLMLFQCHDLFDQVLIFLSGDRIEQLKLGDALRTEVFMGLIRLASHLDRLNEIPSDFLERHEKLLNEDSRLLEYLCVRINGLRIHHLNDGLAWVQKHFDRFEYAGKIDGDPTTQPPEMGMIWNTLAMYAFYTGNPTRALRFVENAIAGKGASSYEDRLRYQCTRGRLLGLIGDTREAIEQLREPLYLIEMPEMSNDPACVGSAPYVHLFLARAYAFRGERNPALRHLQYSQGGSNELDFIRCEVQFLMVQNQIELNQAIEEWSKLQLDDRTGDSEVRRLLIDRVDRFKRGAEARLRGEDSFSPHLVYQAQLEQFGICSRY